MTTKLTKLFIEFFESEKTSGVVLILCIIISIAAANSCFGESYSNFWHHRIGFDIGVVSLAHSVGQWINDGLMAIFFLLIGLEIERELYIGELSDLQNASLPIVAAFGGMAIPAFFHWILNQGTETKAGFGIPIATDIAFAVGVLALLGNRVPTSLKIFMASLAIIDDLGSILIIALFYMTNVSFLYLFLALGIFAGLLILNRLRIHKLIFYLIPGFFMWYFMLKSGIHPTITGVMLAFAIPFVNGDEDSPSYKLQHFLHQPVAFIIIPVFALANTSITFANNWTKGLVSLNSLGIITGLVYGKPLGIFLFSALAVKMGLSQLPKDLSWKHIIGAGFLGGIGFTMSIFITLLAFDDPSIVQSSKISILLSSLMAGTVGFLILKEQNIMFGMLTSKL